MGDLNVKSVQNKQDLQNFIKNLLKDVHALEKLLKDGWFETGITRIGAEQEMCLVDANRKPACVNLEALELINDKDFTTELAQFNLEANLMPLEFKDKCLSQMHANIKKTLENAIVKVKELDVEVALYGILPTIRKSDVDISKITPLARYHALMDGLKHMRGEDFELRLSGLDEINIRQETAMLEACNTSFQVHFQVNPDEFAAKYNVAQAVAGPVMSAAVNSPMLFGRRLWKETRIALFQQSLDIRTFSHHLRDRSPRVTFGNGWLKKSIVEIYHEDIARFQVLLSTDIDEDPFDQMAKGVTPKLRALNIHNSTVYRWNRPCYGISDNGKPHLRIENRIFAAGPSLPDEMANATFWLGLMNGFEDEYKDITKFMQFDDAKSNFFSAARHGLDTKFNWVNGKKVQPSDLILEELIPICYKGLEKAGIDKDDATYYLDIIKGRVESGRTGAQWALDSFTNLREIGTPRDEIATSITAAIINHQGDGKPVHKWELAKLDDIDYEPSSLLVEECMNTDLVTVNEDDILDLVANLMDWRKVRHVLVEEVQEKGRNKLIGLTSSRTVMRYFAKRHLSGSNEPIGKVKDIMVTHPVTISPRETITRAVELMQEHQVGCLPVTIEDELVGVITESDFLTITGALIKRNARKYEAAQQKLATKKQDMKKKATMEKKASMEKKPTEEA